ncbi:MAG: peptide deformylase [Chloroflexi bacterium]|jgi:peptide deformylase|nr:peptide deformylase [Chloroflexota bacterium]MBK7177882.1 peptide deformylase [Chloroflexota bacterium]MBK7916175.1 peptide deformylase [Chloroflexota bacterium]MBK8930838.1 peptide deformylase [Chloroflexota bacterium]MBP6804121.1 peptide deformylase [Chloroflexota bacterium]
MSLLEIVKLPDKILRQKMRPVTSFNGELQDLIDDMIETMRDANGVGLAAPQINRNLQLSVIETLPKHDDDGREIPNSRDLYVIANPEIIWRSRTIVDGIEGCLSIPGYLGEVDRHEAIRVRALDRHGKPIKLRLNGWTARIFQHEIDHLNGVLYIDKLTAPENFWTEEEFRQQYEHDEDDDAPTANEEMLA